VQFTPPGSQASIQFGEGTRFDVSGIWHLEPGRGAPGLDPERRSSASRASFADPDGNAWVLQESRSASRAAL